LNVVDSSGWLEYFAGSLRARHFEEAILQTELLIIPVICLYEVFKVVNRQRSETDALQAVAAMQQGQVVPLTSELALSGAELSLQYSLPMVDSLIMATAQSVGAEVWTQDSDFEGLPHVRYFPR